MSEEQRDQAVDPAALLQRAQTALLVASSSGGPGLLDFVLRQLLHIFTVLDIADEAVRSQAEQFAERCLSRAPLTGERTDRTLCGSRPVYGAVDLAIIILRKCCGL